MSCVCMYYGGYQFDPTPLLSINRSYTRRGNEGKLFGEVSIQADGVLLPSFGVNIPVPSGTDSDIAKVKVMQDQLIEALIVDRQNLFITDAFGFPILNVFPKVESFNFEEGVWVNRCDYTISFSAQEEEQDEFIASASESWDSTKNNDNTITVNHTINAQGIRGDYPTKNTFDAFTNAKNFVIDRLNQNAALQQFFIDASGYSAYNHTKQETKNLEDGTYSITETWILNNAEYIDNRTISTEYNVEPDGTEFITTNTTGTVLGLSAEDEPDSLERFLAASGAFETIIAGEIGFYNTNGITTKSKVYNEFDGTVTYSLAQTTNPSGLLTNKSIDRQFTRNEDGSTTQTVTTAASVLPRSSGTIQDAIDWVNANIDDIDSDNPPYQTVSGVLISRSSQRNDVEKTFSRTNVYTDAANLTYREEYSINGNLSANGILEVTVQGSVFGLFDEITTSSETRFANAQSGFTIVSGLAFSRASGLAGDFGRTLRVDPISTSVSKNKKNGFIGYNFDYDDTSTPPTGVISQSISINDSGGDAIKPQIGIPGRAAGPVFQDMDTRTPFVRAVNLEWVLKPDFSLASADAAADTVITSYEPTGLITGDILTVQSKNFDPDTRRYTRNVSWTYNATGSGFRLDILGE